MGAISTMEPAPTVEKSGVPLGGWGGGPWTFSVGNVPRRTLKSVVIAPIIRPVRGPPALCIWCCRVPARPCRNSCRAVHARDASHQVAGRHGRPWLPRLSDEGARQAPLPAAVTGADWSCAPLPYSCLVYGACVLEARRKQRGVTLSQLKVSTAVPWGMDGDAQPSFSGG